MRAKLIVVAVLAGLGIGLLWVSGHGYIDIQVRDSQEVTYQIVGKDERSSQTIKTKNGLKKLVGKGSNQVIATTSQGSFLQAVTVKGFLARTTVQPEYKPQNARSFIGDNPSNCMYPIGNRLLSIACGDSFDQLKIHKPASANTPTVAAKPTNPPTGFVEGLVKTTDDTYVLLHDDETSVHNLYRINADGQTSNGKKLGELAGNQDYKVVPYKNGFVAYGTDDEDQPHILAFGANNAAPTKLDFGNAKKGLKFAQVITSGQQVAAVYSDKPERKGTDLSDTEGEEAHSTQFDNTTGTSDSNAQAEVIVLGQGNQLHHYIFDVPAGDIGFCGGSKLCTLSKGRLSVYDVSSNKAQLLYRLNRIDAVRYQPNGFVAAQGSDILVFDTTKQQGYVSLHLETLELCGLEVADKGYTVCTEDTKGKRAALQVDLTATKNLAVEEVVTKLTAVDGVVSISAYGRYIYITPETPEEVYNAEDRAFEYDPAEVAKTNARINKEIDRLGVSRRDYTIVFTVR